MPSTLFSLCVGGGCALLAAAPVAGTIAVADLSLPEPAAAPYAPLRAETTVVLPLASGRVLFPRGARSAVVGSEDRPVSLLTECSVVILQEGYAAPIQSGTQLTAFEVRNRRVPGQSFTVEISLPAIVGFEVSWFLVEPGVHCPEPDIAGSEPAARSKR